VCRRAKKVQTKKVCDLGVHKLVGVLCGFSKATRALQLSAFVRSLRDHHRSPAHFSSLEGPQILCILPRSKVGRTVGGTLSVLYTVRQSVWATSAG
jgi:hypothetical protein